MPLFLLKEPLEISGPVVHVIDFNPVGNRAAENQIVIEPADAERTEVFQACAAKPTWPGPHPRNLRKLVEGLVGGLNEPVRSFRVVFCDVSAMAISSTSTSGARMNLAIGAPRLSPLPQSSEDGFSVEPLATVEFFGALQELCF